MNQEIFSKPRLFGHRGSPADHPENTLASFQACLEKGIDGIELDVQQCKSGQLVVFHDWDLVRLASRPEQIRDLTFTQLQEIDLGEGQGIPLLQEVFTCIQDRLFYDIEIKARSVQAQGLEEQLLGEIRNAKLEDRVLVSSFNPVSLIRFKRLCRNRIPTALIWEDSPTVPRILRHGLPRYLVRPTYLKPPIEQLGKVHRGKRPICLWTVDESRQAQELLDAGVWGIVSNRPRELRQLFIG